MSPSPPPFQLDDNSLKAMQESLQKALNDPEKIMIAESDIAQLNAQASFASSPEFKIYSEKLYCILETVMDYPGLIEKYFSTESMDLLNLPPETSNSSTTKEAIDYFTRLFEKYPIKDDELLLICGICLCKFDFHWLSKSEQLKIKETQKQGYEKIKKDITETDRFKELVILANNVINIFSAVLGI